MLKTIEKLKTDGWKVLITTLGLAEATRFLLQYQKGSGDYIKYRKKIFKNVSVKDIVKEYKKGR
jgi:hypothetical protein